MGSPVTHFEIYAENPAELAEFYRSLFGWKIERAPGTDYFKVQTVEDDANAIRGGLTRRPIPEPRSWVHYVSVSSLDETVARVVSLGGKVLRRKTAVPKAAWYAAVSDPDGNIFAILAGSDLFRRHQLRYLGRDSDVDLAKQLYHYGIDGARRTNTGARCAPSCRSDGVEEIFA